MGIEPALLCGPSSPGGPQLTVLGVPVASFIKANLDEELLPATGAAIEAAVAGPGQSSMAW